MIIVLTGANTQAIHSELQVLLSNFQITHGDSIERFDGNEMQTADGLLDAVRSVSFLEPKKLVIARNFGQHKELMEKIEDVVAQTADSTDLVLVDQKVDKRTAAYKFLQKNVDVRVFGELGPQELEQWVIDNGAEQSLKIGRSEARALIERAGTNQLLLSKEIEKLALVTDSLTTDLIAKHITQRPQGKVFAMLDALFQGRTRSAWLLYQDQRTQGEEPQKIIGMITWQLQQLTLAVHAPEQTKQELVSAGVSPYSAQKLLQLAKRISAADIRRYVNELAAIDAASKTNADVESALEAYFSSLAISS